MSNAIASANIHPAIGVARVGNGTRDDGRYHGPETPDPDPMPVGSLKDATALARCAAELDTITAAHLRNRRTFYGLEHRWPRHAFRHRRHTAGPTDHADGRPNTRFESIPPPGAPA